MSETGAWYSAQFKHAEAVWVAAREEFKSNPPSSIERSKALCEVHEKSRDLMQALAAYENARREMS